MGDFFGRGGGARTKVVWYALPPVFTLALVWDVLRGRRRSFGADAIKLLRVLRPQPEVENADLIPPESPFVVVTNHYCRQGLGVWWSVLLIGQALARWRPELGEVRWVMTNQWTYQDPVRSRLVTPLTRWLFHRIARSYGFVPMPPMPPNPSHVEERAQAVRRALSLAQGGAIIGLAPEGREGSDSSLIAPPVGVGRFLLLLAKAGLPILTVGVAEKNGTLTASFGEPFILYGQPGLGKRQQDRQACQIVMVAIGKLLSPELWGVYREQIDAEDPLLDKGEGSWPD
jgi:1-acyl-sn-glycerol-3-phosphate acyltransferase